MNRTRILALGVLSVALSAAVHATSEERIRYVQNLNRNVMATLDGSWGLSQNSTTLLFHLSRRGTSRYYQRLEDMRDCRKMWSYMHRQQAAMRQLGFTHYAWVDGDDHKLCEVKR